MAQAQGGTFLLRIEDIDSARSCPAWEAQIYDDLQWLGLTWPTPVMRQSDRRAHYDTALDTLWNTHQLRPCACTRRELIEAASAPQEGAPHSACTCPGTCMEQPSGHPWPPRPRDCHLRWPVSMATSGLEHHIVAGHDDHRGLFFTETGPAHCGRVFISRADYQSVVGDVVLARRDIGTSYHLSVVVDDAAQGVTHVVRGEDLFDATPVHVFLQHRLCLPTPVYHHHRLIRDDHGKRLAKRDDARALSKYRAEGATPDDIRRMVGLDDGLA